MMITLRIAGLALFVLMIAAIVTGKPVAVAVAWVGFGALAFLRR